MKVFWTSGLLLPLVATIYGYNFEDSYYNGALSSHLESVRNSLQESRVRRTTEKQSLPTCFRMRTQCCALSLFMDQNDEIQKAYQECFTEIYEQGKNKQNYYAKRDKYHCNNVEQRRLDIVCYVQCVALKQGVTDSNGKMIEKSYTTWTRNVYKDIWILSELHEILPKCFEETRSNTTTRFMSVQTKSSCNTALIAMDHCVFREIQMRCPDEQIDDPDMCARYRQYVEREQQEGDPSQTV